MLLQHEFECMSCHRIFSEFFDSYEEYKKEYENNFKNIKCPGVRVDNCRCDGKGEIKRHFGTININIKWKPEKLNIEKKYNKMPPPDFNKNINEISEKIKTKAKRRI